ncbi:fatty acid transporter [Iodobacter sp. HSC-16F04]|uniref:Fatty acid transporter n=1 Tax=Iodobacter violaceini TaxID=3044271 RepID=A0ABX0KUS5_9NEIS|nr:outer membrane protein transport protein [Iodobacter violacea]NHQ88421.1 fatty acid transporter [Iodobacter violacea]
MKPQLLALLLAGLSGSSWAGGLYLYELGTEDVGLAGAGSAARAQDATTIATNPAGMTMLEGDQLTIGLQGLYGDAKYQQDGRGAFSGNEAGNVVGWFPGMSVFYSHSVDEQLKVGIGVYGNFGLGLDFGDWAGSRLIKRSTLLGMTIQPTVAYKINDQWSVGGSINANYGVFSLTRSTPGGDVELNDTDWSASIKLGVLYQPDHATRLGLSYTSETEYNFNSSVNHPLGGQIPASGSINAPQQLMFSAFHQLAPQWAVMANLGWQNWEAYNDNQLWLGNNEAPNADRMQDTWHTALGLQYQATPALRLNTGIAYDSSFYKDQQNTSMTMPSGEAWRFGLGGQYQLNKTDSLGVAFEYVHFDSAYVPSPLLSGAYHSPKMYFITANYSKKF